MWYVCVPVHAGQLCIQSRLGEKTKQHMLSAKGGHVAAKLGKWKRRCHDGAGGWRWRCLTAPSYRHIQWKWRTEGNWLLALACLRSPSGTPRERVQNMAQPFMVRFGGTTRSGRKGTGYWQWRCLVPNVTFWSTKRRSPQHGPAFRGQGLKPPNAVGALALGTGGA